MKILFLILLLLLISSGAYSQDRSALAGIWKATVKAGNKPTTPTYLVFNADGTYLWGVDSSGNPSNQVTKGQWDITTEGDIKIIPADATDVTRYYRKISDNKYKYDSFDKDGIKTKDRMLEMDWYLEKMQ